MEKITFVNIHGNLNDENEKRHLYINANHIAYYYHECEDDSKCGTELVMANGDKIFFDSNTFDLSAFAEERKIIKQGLREDFKDYLDAEESN